MKEGGASIHLQKTHVGVAGRVVVVGVALSVLHFFAAFRVDNRADCKRERETRAVSTEVWEEGEGRG